MEDANGRKVIAYRARKGLMRRPQFRAKVIQTKNGRTLWETSESYTNRLDLIERINADFWWMPFEDRTLLK